MTQTELLQLITTEWTDRNIIIQKYQEKNPQTKKSILRSLNKLGFWVERKRLNHKDYIRRKQ